MGDVAATISTPFEVIPIIECAVPASEHVAPVR